MEGLHYFLKRSPFLTTKPYVKSSIVVHNKLGFDGKVWWSILDSEKKEKGQKSGREDYRATELLEITQKSNN